MKKQNWIAILLVAFSGVIFADQRIAGVALLQPFDFSIPGTLSKADKLRLEKPLDEARFLVLKKAILADDRAQNIRMFEIDLAALNGSDAWLRPLLSLLPMTVIAGVVTSHPAGSSVLVTGAEVSALLRGLSVNPSVRDIEFNMFFSEGARQVLLSRFFANKNLNGLHYWINNSGDVSFTVALGNASYQRTRFMQHLGLIVTKPVIDQPLLLRRLANGVRHYEFGPDSYFAIVAPYPSLTASEEKTLLDYFETTNKNFSRSALTGVYIFDVPIKNADSLARLVKLVSTPNFAPGSSGAGVLLNVATWLKLSAGQKQTLLSTPVFKGLVESREKIDDEFQVVIINATDQVVISTPGRVFESPASAVIQSNSKNTQNYNNLVEASALLDKQAVQLLYHFNQNAVDAKSE